MRKSLGGIVIIDTSPARFSNDPLPSAVHPQPQDETMSTRRKGAEQDVDKGNQATALFFPVFAACLLVLLSTLSTTVIGGLDVARVDMGVNGTVKIGAWGWCTEGVPGYDDKCSASRAFGSSMASELASLPEPVRSLAGIGEAIRPPYLIANGAMHVIACIVTWVTMMWTLAAAGSWKGKEQCAHDLTRWAFSGSGLSALFVLVAWSLELGLYTRIQSSASNTVGTDASVKPGATIFMMLLAFLLSLSAYITRLTWGQFRPRPKWTIKGYSDFHRDPVAGVPIPGMGGAAPSSAALPPSEDLPPSWGSLNLSDAREVVLDEKPSIAQPGFAV